MQQLMRVAPCYELPLHHRSQEKAEDAPRPVRVCFLIDELASAGTETQLLALIRHLKRDRVLPYLCLLRGDNPRSQALEPETCPVLRLQVRSLRNPRTLIQAGRFIRFLRRERIDVVQAYFPDSSYFGIPAAWLAGVKHRLRTRNNVGHWITPLHRQLGRVLNLFTTATLVNCKAAREAFLQSERCSPESVCVLENGVDLERFRNIPPIDASRVPVSLQVGCVSNLRPVKGLDVFVQAATLVRKHHPQTIFTVAGEGELREALQLQAKANGLADCFLLPGCVSNVPHFLARLDVAVLCSHAEGMSNALLEYMAAGRPIVATKVGAAADVIEDGKNGLLVPAGNSCRLAEAIQCLLSDRPLAARLAASAREQAFRRFSRASMVQRFEEYYACLNNPVERA